MNDSNNNQFNPRNRLLAKLALLAHTGKHTPKGAVPYAEELAMLVDGQLDFKRKEEVISHLNSDPVLFEQWTQLVDIIAIENKETANVEQKAGWFAWITQWQTLAASMAFAGIATVLLLQSNITGLNPNINTQPQITTTQSKTEIKTKQFISPDKRAIAAGINNSLKLNKATLGLKLNLDIAIDEQGSALTPELYQNYYQLGQEVAEIALQCKRDTPVTANQLISIIKKLERNSFIKVPELLTAINSETTQKQSCIKINNFLKSEL